MDECQDLLRRRRQISLTKTKSSGREDLLLSVGDTEEIKVVEESTCIRPFRIIRNNYFLLVKPQTVGDLALIQICVVLTILKRVFLERRSECAR